MSIEDEGRPSVRPAHIVGEDLATLSEEELKERIDLLKGEIERIETTLKGKEASRIAADAFFKS